MSDQPKPRKHGYPFAAFAALDCRGRSRVSTDECLCGTDKACDLHGIPSKHDKPTGEWTADYVADRFTIDASSAGHIADAHNVALDAEQEKAENLRRMLRESEALTQKAQDGWDTCIDERNSSLQDRDHFAAIDKTLREQLAAEREKQPKHGNMAWQEIQQLREQLAAAQAWIEEATDQLCGDKPLDKHELLASYDKLPDTTALDAAIAAAQQPLVDALNDIGQDAMRQGDAIWMRDTAKDALAKVKEGK